MKINLLIVAVCSFILLAGCKRVDELPESAKGKYYNYNNVKTVICAQRGKCVITTGTRNGEEDTIVFIDNGCVFTIKKSDGKVLAENIFEGVIGVEKIFPYAGVTIALTDEGEIYLVDGDKHYQEVDIKCEEAFDLEVEGGRVVLIEKNNRFFDFIGFDYFVYVFKKVSDLKYYEDCSCFKDESGASLEDEEIIYSPEKLLPVNPLLFQRIGKELYIHQYNKYSYHDILSYKKMLNDAEQKNK